MNGNGKKRLERDSMGMVEVPEDRYWGAQTQRAIENFAIGEERMPAPLIRAFGLQKQAAAQANLALGRLSPEIADAIVQAAAEVAALDLLDHFPLRVWQAGSGTPTHMNVNEVIANRASCILGKVGKVHPNDHVNLGQSTNDSFPTAIHIATAEEIRRRLLPALDLLRGRLTEKAEAFSAIVKIGRTHLQDATPMTLGQEFGGYAAQVAAGSERVASCLTHLYQIAQGGTAVGTGVNAAPGFDREFAAQLGRLTGMPFTPAPDKFAANGAIDTLVEVSGMLNALAVSLSKIASDIRLLASGPRCGLGELNLPELEPGSSIMPGKLNPTQAEAVNQVAARVIGNHVTVTFSAAQAQLELALFKPVVALSVLQSIRLLSDAAQSFAERCVAGILPDRARIAAYVGSSLMLVTALAPHIGYDRAAEIAIKAHRDGTTLRNAALALGHVSPEDFDRWVRPEAMLGPN